MAAPSRRLPHSCQPQHRPIGFRMSCVTPFATHTRHWTTSRPTESATRFRPPMDNHIPSGSPNERRRCGRGERGESREETAGEWRKAERVCLARLSPFSTLLLYCRGAAMEAAGIEPASRSANSLGDNALQDASASQSAYREHRSDSTRLPLTARDSHHDTLPPDLALIAGAWPMLPPHVRETILTLVECSEKQRSNS